VLATHWLRFDIYAVLLIDDAPTGGGSVMRDQSQVGDVRKAPSPIKQTRLEDPLRPATRFSPSRQSWSQHHHVHELGNQHIPHSPRFDRRSSVAPATGHTGNTRGPLSYTPQQISARHVTCTTACNICTEETFVSPGESHKRRLPWETRRVLQLIAGILVANRSAQLNQDVDRPLSGSIHSAHCRFRRFCCADTIRP
jgi:hypothetical protein